MQVVVVAVVAVEVLRVVVAASVLLLVVAEPFSNVTRYYIGESRVLGYKASEALKTYFNFAVFQQDIFVFMEQISSLCKTKKILYHHWQRVCSVQTLTFTRSR